MALSDEDYGILYNFVKSEDRNPNWDVRIILREYMVKEQDTGLAITDEEHVKSFASFIILSEGRELP